VIEVNHKYEGSPGRDSQGESKVRRTLATPTGRAMLMPFRHGQVLGSQWWIVRV